MTTTHDTLTAVLHELRLIRAAVAPDPAPRETPDPTERTGPITSEPIELGSVIVADFFYCGDQDRKVFIRIAAGPGDPWRPIGPLARRSWSELRNARWATSQERRTGDVDPAADTTPGDDLAPGTDVTDRLDTLPPGTIVADEDCYLWKIGPGLSAKLHDRMARRWSVWPWTLRMLAVYGPITIATPEHIAAAGIPEDGAR